MDHLLWTQRFAHLVERQLQLSEDVSAPKGKEVWVAGTVSPMTRKNYEKQGLIIKENTLNRLTLD
jgi:LDH2 family malate/lactate/ureidoglycolate dehydrogenase